MTTCHLGGLRERSSDGRSRRLHEAQLRHRLEQAGVARELEERVEPGTLARTEGGLGIGFISEWFIEEELASGALKPLLVPWCPPFGGLRLYYPGRRFVPARLRALIDLIHELRLAAN
mgnify:CR=1 FL=1